MVGKGLVKRTSHASARNNQEEDLLSGLFSVYKIYVLIRVWLIHCSSQNSLTESTLIDSEERMLKGKNSFSL